MTAPTVPEVTSEVLVQLAAMAAMVVVNVGTLPQVRLAVRRRGDCPGVSVAAACMVAASCLGWAVYSVASDLALSAVSSAVGLVLWSTVTVAVLSRARVRELVTPALFTAALTLAWVLWGRAGLATVLIVQPVVTTVPQLWRLRHSTVGLSRTTWATSAVAAACWVAYGAVHADAALVVSQSFRTLVALAVVVGATVLRSREGAGRVGPALVTGPPAKAPR